MTLTGTEAEIINCIAQLRQATKDQIRRTVGFSLDYIGFLCQYLTRKGYLTFVNGHYSLAQEGIKILLREETPKVDRKLLKEIADELAKEISDKLKKTVQSIKIPASVREIKKEVRDESKEPIKIKTDFELPIEDESLDLETNIDKIGTKLEKEKSDIANKVELLQRLKIKKGGKNEQKKGR